MLVAELSVCRPVHHDVMTLYVGHSYIRLAVATWLGIRLLPNVQLIALFWSFVSTSGCRFLSLSLFLSGVVCHMSYVMCHVSCVVCRVSCVVCRMSCDCALMRGDASDLILVRKKERGKKEREK